MPFFFKAFTTFSHTAKNNLVIHVAGWYSTTHELQGQQHKMLLRAVVVGVVAFAIERKPTAATVVDSGSPTEAAPGLQNCGGVFFSIQRYNQQFQLRSPTRRLRGKASHL